MKTYEERMQSVQGKLRKKQTQRKALMATAGMLCMCIIAGIVLPYFKDDSDIQMYADNEYFKVIEAINRDFPNRDEKDFWWSWITEEDTLVNSDRMEAMTPVDPVPEAPGEAPDYSLNGDIDDNSSVEITDH